MSSAPLTGVPDVDLVLELYDDQGQRLAKVDGAGPGEPERLGPVAAGAGELYVRARPVWTAGQPPAPGSPVPYELTVDWRAPRADMELEANDTPERANAVDREGGVSGHLSAAEDEDWYRITVPPGQVVDVEVEGVDGIDVAVLVGAGRTRHDEAGVGEDEELGGLAPDGSGAVLLGIVEQPPKAKGKKAARPERDEPYTLKIKFRAR